MWYSILLMLFYIIDYIVNCNRLKPKSLHLLRRFVQTILQWVFWMELNYKKYCNYNMFNSLVLATKIKDCFNFIYNFYYLNINIHLQNIRSITEIFPQNIVFYVILISLCIITEIWCTIIVWKSKSINKHLKMLCSLSII